MVRHGRLYIDNHGGFDRWSGVEGRRGSSVWVEVSGQVGEERGAVGVLSEDDVVGGYCGDVVLDVGVCGFELGVVQGLGFGDGGAECGVGGGAVGVTSAAGWDGHGGRLEDSGWDCGVGSGSGAATVAGCPVYGTWFRRSGPPLLAGTGRPWRRLVSRRRLERCRGNGDAIAGRCGRQGAASGLHVGGFVR